jgi:hypothetical protein
MRILAHVWDIYHCKPFLSWQLVRSFNCSNIQIINNDQPSPNVHLICTGISAQSLFGTNLAQLYVSFTQWDTFIDQWWHIWHFVHHGKFIKYWCRL